jgi:hypothetical protein
MAFEPGNKLGNKIKKGEVRNPNGRPKKMLTTIKDLGYTKTQIEDTLNIIMVLNPTELRKVAANKESTALEITLAKSVLKGIKTSSQYNMMQLIERLHGKPQETASLNLPGKVKVTLNL